MIQLCKYIIPASRAHPSVSTTRLAPKHPQRCVGVLWAKTGRLLLIASTWIRKPRKVCMILHVLSGKMENSENMLYTCWHAIYNKLVGQDYPDGMHVGSKRSTSIFIPSRDSKGSRLGTRGRGTSSRQRVQQQWKPKPWRASHLAWCGNLRFASIFNKG